MSELDGVLELGKDFGNDFVFEGFGVLDGEGVVVVEHEDGVAGAPDIEHRGIDYVCKGALWIVGDCLAEGGVVGTSAPELALAAVEGDIGPSPAEGVVGPVGPSFVGGEGAVVFPLEFFHGADWDTGLGG